MDPDSGAGMGVPSSGNERGSCKCAGMIMGMGVLSSGSDHAGMGVVPVSAPA